MKTRKVNGGETTQKGGKAIGIIAAILGILLVGLAGYLFLKEKLFLQTAEQSTATVTANIRHTYTGQVNEYGVQHFYCSEFEFQTRDGRDISFKESDGTNLGCTEVDSPPDYEIGDHVIVYYNSKDPIHTAQTPKSVKLNYSSGAVVGVIGVLLFLFGAVLFVSGLLKSRRVSNPKPGGK
jgi:hypothetical protein